MKKLIPAAVAALLLAGAGGGWYVFSHRATSMQLAREDLRRGDTRAAMIQLRGTVRDDPGNAEAHALLSQLQLASGDPVAAEKEIKAARSLGWDKFKVLDVLAQAYSAQSKWTEILAEIPVEGATADETASFLVTRSLAQRGSQDVAAAKASIAAAKVAAPKNVQVWLVAARLEAGRENEQAYADVEQALALDAHNAEALQLKAQLKLGEGKKQEGMALLDEAVAAAPANTGLKLERAAQAIGLGQDAKAREDVAAVQAKDPNNVVANYMKMVLLLRENKAAEADLIEQKLDAVIGQFQRGLYFKAIIKGSLNQLESAENAIKAYVARLPQDLDGVRLLARIALAARRPADAIPALRSAVAAGAADAETLDLLGRAYALDGNRNDAEAAFKQASSASDTTPGALTRLATSRMQIGDLSGAALDLEHSLEIAPSTPGAGEALVATALRIGDLDRAQAALDRLREQVGDTEAVGLLSGLLKTAQLDPEGALKAFQDTARKFPDSAAARLNEARLLLQMGRRAEAIPVLQGVLARNKTSTDALTLLVQILVEEKRGPEAIAAVEAAQAAAPGNLGITQGHAELLARLGDLPRAQAVLEAAKVNGVLPAALLPVQARLQLASGQIDAAKASMAALVQAEPGNMSARIAQIELLARQKDYQAARVAASDALAKAPTNALLLGMSVAIEQADKGFDAALVLADQLRADPAHLPAAAALKGDLLASQKRFGEAAAAFASEFKADPTTGLLLRWTGALQAKGDVAQAMSELKRYQTDHPKDADVAQTLAALELAQHKNAEAEHDLKIVLAERPNDPVALNNLAWILQLRGDKQALALAQRAYMQNQSPESADTLGWVLTAQGQPAKAVPLLQRASAMRPQSDTTKYHLAVALKDAGRKDEAVTVLKSIASTAAFDEKPVAAQLLTELTKPK